MCVSGCAVVDRKLAHPRNWRQRLDDEEDWRTGEELDDLPERVQRIRSRALMLSLILYTGCDSNYAMSAALRRGELDEWPWFSFLLYVAVEKLSKGSSAEDVNKRVYFSGASAAFETALRLNGVETRSTVNSLLLLLSAVVCW